MSVPVWLNYHHLLYFHATAREGSMTAAAKKLRLAQPTLSGQIKQLEDMLGEPLFERRGRRLELTEAGRTVYHYAEEIFGLGQELLQAVRGRPAGRPLRFAVGVSDSLPKLMVYRLLAPVLELPGGARLEVQDGEVAPLLAELGAHRLDLVLTDAPLPTGSGIRAYSHALGDCGLTFFARAAVAETLRPRFPQSLDGARLLLPAKGSALRRALDEWLDRLDLSPEIVGEIGDSALIKVFGQAGAGAFAVPTAVAEEVGRQYEVVAFGATKDVRERFWAISPERRIRHPAVSAVVDEARRVFA
jgi:LysR family transcriptional activator of nhaA